MLSNNGSSPEFIERLVAELGLSDDQAARVDDVLKRAVMDRKVVRGFFGHGDFKERRANLRLITSRADHELATILSDTQFSAYVSFRNKMRRAFHSRRT